MGLAFIPVYLHYLGAEGYGLIGFFALLQAWLSLLDLSIGQTLNREVARFQTGAHTPSGIWTLVRSCEAVALAAALAAVGVIGWGADWLAGNWVRAISLSVDQVAQAIVLMGVVVGLRVLESLYRGALVGTQRHVLLNVLGAVVATLRWGGAALMLAVVRADVLVFFAWQVLASLAAVLIYGFTLYQVLARPPGRVAVSVRALATVWRFSAAMLATGALALVLTQMDKLLLSRLLSLEAFGAFSIAVLASNALYQLVGPVTQAYSPRLTALVAQHNEPGLRRTYHQGAQAMAVVLAPGALVLSTFSEPILKLWTQDASLAHQAAPVLSWLALGTMLNGLMGMPHMLQLAHGWPGLAVRINLVAVAFMVPLLLAVAPRQGAIGTAQLWLGLNIVTMLAGAHLMHRRLLPREQARWYWEDTAKPVIAAAAVVASSAFMFPASLPTGAELMWLGLTAALALAAAAGTSNSLRQRIKALGST